MDMIQNLRQKLSELPKERLLDYMEMQCKNLWTLQNNYMVNLEERYGHELATEFDSMCFGRMAEVAYYRLKRFFDLGDDIESLRTCKQYFVAEPGTEGEVFRKGDNRIVTRITKCNMQLERKKRGAPELPCKPALFGVMDRAVKAINPKFEIIRHMAPPDPHPENLWCELEVELED